jgi:hypothetical protein
MTVLLWLWLAQGAATEPMKSTCTTNAQSTCRTQSDCIDFTQTDCIKTRQARSVCVKVGAQERGTCMYYDRGPQQ